MEGMQLNLEEGLRRPLCGGALKETWEVRRGRGGSEGRASQAAGRACGDAQRQG